MQSDTSAQKKVSNGAGADLQATNEPREPRLYELGFHVVPTVPENALAEKGEELRKAITDNGGSVVSEEAPQHTELAYEMEHKTTEGIQRFGTAYFGWFHFTAAPDRVADIHRAVSTTTSVLRFIIVEAPVTGASEEQSEHDSEEKADEPKTASGETNAAPAERSSGVVSEDELDKTIDDLVIN